MQTDNIVQRFQAIKTKVDSMKQEKVILSTKTDTYKEQYNNGIKELKEKFGINSLAEAKATLENLKSEMETLVTDLDNKMKPFEQVETTSLDLGDL